MPFTSLQLKRGAAIIAATALLPLSLLASAWSGHWPAERQKLRVTVIDVGEGDSILVQTPTGRTMLIDGGGTRSLGLAGQAAESSIGEKVVVPFLRSEGVSEINVLLITHPHGDHIGGLAAVLRDLKVDSVLDGTTLDYPSSTYHALLTQMAALHIPYKMARRGGSIDFRDGVTGELLNPPVDGMVYGTGFDDKTINDYSAVVRLSYGTTTFLLDGDAEVEAEQNMLQTYPRAYLHADFLKAGHHGSRNASSDDWLDAVHPAAAAISCGKNNVFMHPHPETLARFTAHHIQTFRTDQECSIVAESDGKTVTVATLNVTLSQ